MNLTCRSTCGGNEYVEDTFPFFRVELTPEYAALLLAYRPVFEAAQAFNDNLYCLEFFHYEAEWGTWPYDWKVEELEADYGEWYAAPDRAFEKERTDCDTLKIVRGGVMWAASPKHGSGNMESETVTWDWLEAISGGVQPPLPPLPLVSTVEEVGEGEE
jgi:hypothetical protein